MKSGLEIFLLSGYVDDGRQLTTTLCPGMRFNKSEKIFTFEEKGLQEDVEMQMKGESTNQRMARVCREAMDSINPDLKFTTESQEDYPEERLPTLDFSIWLTEDNVLKHTYFQKNMKTPYVIMERSGNSYHQKFQILSNELVRRLSNIDISLPKYEVLKTT